MIYTPRVDQHTPSDMQNQAEQRLVTAAAVGLWADFRGEADDQRIVRAASIRSLLSGEPLDADDSAFRPGAAVKLRGAIIAGVLDLTDLRTRGGDETPPLLLEDCVIGAPAEGEPSAGATSVLVARHARLARLSLVRCQVAMLDLYCAVIGGTFTFLGAQAEPAGPPCTVMAIGLRVGGDVLIADVHLDTPSVPLRDAIPAIAFGLDLSDARIAGSLSLEPGCKADGGISLARAEISGDLRARGARLSTHQEMALTAPFLCVHGAVLLTSVPLSTVQGTDDRPPESRFEAVGGISFDHARLKLLDLRGAEITRAPGGGGRLTLKNAELVDLFLGTAPGPDVARASFHSQLPVSCNGAEFRGSVHAYQSRFHISHNAELSFDGATILGDLDLSRLHGPAVSMRGASVGRDLYLSNVRVRRIEASNVRVGGTCHWSGDLSGAASFAGMRVGGDLRLGNAGTPLRILYNETIKTRVDLEDITVDRDLTVASIAPSYVERIDWESAQAVDGRWKLLPFYKEGIALIELLFRVTVGERPRLVVVSYLTDQRNIYLLSTSPPVHEVNQKASLQLTNEQQVAEYVRFFGAHVWGAEGAFSVIASQRDFDGLVTTTLFRTQGPSGIRVTRHPRSGWLATCDLLYGHSLWNCVFRIETTGMVEMIKNNFAGIVTERRDVTFASPFRLYEDRPQETPREHVAAIEGAELATPAAPWPAYSFYETDTPWTSIPRVELDNLVSQVLPGYSDSVEQSRSSHAQPIPVSLRGSKVGTLDDRLGQSWGEGMRLDLEGFAYERFGTSEVGSPWHHDPTLAVRSLIKGRRLDASFSTAFRMLASIIRGQLKARGELPVWRHRVDWLNRQFRAGRPGRGEFRSQPYEQVARALRMHGDNGGAARIVVERLRAERRALPVGAKRFGLWSLDTLFGYGVLSWPAMRTFVLVWLLGWAGVEIANSGQLRWPPVGLASTPLIGASFTPVMVVETRAVSTLAVAGAERRTVAAEAVTSLPDGRLVSEIRCGQQIEPWLYALDVLVPLLDLKQEDKCTVSASPEAWRWRLAKALYAFAGWIVTSAVILAISGLVQRQSDSR